ncbi:4'-phosphopantetheinyl transferase family protein [Serratia microhaemolytica]|uniref:4'-phosphopantetheinyl transferase family protein n=1 Tax=Serratia microhaemolytica TaxID=2675110 RepID=UPI000FDE18BF|nr:4'-phosphopantetheinyl transferase superfamily protein [Serratia microhaemolytica]
MSTAFVRDLEFLPIADFPGRVAQCRFALAEYSDQLFSHLAIPFPTHLSRAVTKRRAEYLAGRYLARLLLAQFGYPNVILPRGEDRAPCWPTGIIGSLSHNIDTVLCAVQPTTGRVGVGIDVESCLSIERAEELLAMIAQDSEAAWLRQQGYRFDFLLTLLFSAKESLFKAVYPHVGCYFDFLDAMIVELNLPQGYFELELQKTLNVCFYRGRRFSGRFWFNDQRVTTLLYF